ncbi:MAG: porin, partial [Terracidiphilus sp.]
MLRAFECSPNTLRTATARTAAAMFLYAAMAMSLVCAAQQRDPLPSAPQPQLASPTQLAQFAQTHPSLLTDDPQRGGVGRKATDMSPVGHEPQDAPITTMAPHPEGNSWWLSGQANIIFQGRLPFHSAYQGVNSFRNSAEYKTSMVGTFYTAWRPTHSIRNNTDLILDIESAGGRGLSQALGLAGFTNLDVVRNPNLGSTPYLARYQIHQVIGFTNKTTSQEPGFFALAPSVPLRRVEFRIGKLTLPDFFDINGPGGDSHLQFMNWTVDNNGAWDYAADTRGYTVGGILEYDDRIWSARYAIAAMPTVANGIDLDWAFSRANGQNWEFELRKGLFAPLLNPKREGAIRVLSYVNHAHMG